MTSLLNLKYLSYTNSVDPDINIGLIRLILKRSGDELKEIIDEFLSDILEILDLGLNLSDLDEIIPD